MGGLKEFLAVSCGDGSGFGFGSGSGSGSGFGCGSGYGYGYGFGCGDGSGFGDGSGYGFGSGSGFGFGSGYGFGCGDGSGFGDGSGYGYGYGSGIKSIKGIEVNIIDDVPTIITVLRGNVAKGFILNRDLTFDKCFVVKSGNTFAHGSTLHEAQSALMDKMFEDMDEDERIKLFMSEFNLTDKYPAKMFFEWHNRLTGSCLMGRENFCKNHMIDINTAEFTVKEFIDLTKEDYGGSIIRRLESEVNHD